MVIFHSYVKLPEGNIHWKFINYSSLKRSVRCQLPASRFPLVISLRRQSIDAIVYDDLSLGGSHGRGWISMGGSQWCFFSISRTSFSWKMLKVCIDIYCIFGIGTAHRGNSQKVRDNERQDPSGISGFLLTILVDKSPQSSWAKWGIPSPIGSGWPCPPAIWTRCPPITTWRTGDSGWSTQSKPTDAQTELVGDYIYIYMIYIYIYIYVCVCVCVFSCDMIKWSIHLYYDDSSKLSSQRIVHVFPCFSARLEAERIGFGFCAIPRVRSSWSILWCRRRQNQLRFIVDICGWMSLACRIWLIMVYYGDSAG